MLIIRVVVCFWISSLVFGICGEKYEIRFERESKVGDVTKFEMSGATVSEMETSVNGEFQGVKRTDELTEVVSRSVTTKVDDEGDEVEGTSLLTSVKYRGAEDKKFRLIAENERVTSKELEDGTELYKEGKPIVGVLRDAMKLCIPGLIDDDKEKGDKSSDATMDEIFGAVEKKEVGDVWKFNKEAFLSDMPKEMQKAMDIKTLRGETRFVELVEVDGVRCMKLAAEASCVLLSLPNVGEEMKMGEGNKLKVKIEAIVPLDVRMAERVLSLEYVMAMDMEMAHQVGPVNMVGKYGMYMNYKLLEATRVHAVTKEVVAR